MIVISILTYDRLEVAKRCILSVSKYLKASEEFWLHLADDGSSQDYRDELAELARSLYGNSVSMSNSQRSGYGGNYNASTQITHQVSDLMLPLEDDWEMQRELNLDPIAAVLRDGIFGCVRLAYIGATQELRAKFVLTHGYHWLALDPDSPERHVWAGGPRIETVEWEKAVGPWPEHMEQGYTEHIVAAYPAARYGIAWPVGLIYPQGDVFAHIGGEKASINGIDTSKQGIPKIKDGQ